MKRSARLTSETKPEGIKASTWSMIQGYNARRKALLAGPGNAAKAKALARVLWEAKDGASGHMVKIVGVAKPVAATAPVAKRIRLGAPLRFIPKCFTKKSFA
jgi:hypothetical protein